MAPFPIPDDVMLVLQRLWGASHAAYVVGGNVRDGLLGRPSTSDGLWDMATDALPEQTLALFPGSSYTNRFGTVLAGPAEITTFRRDHRYGDHRRPDEVTFSDSLDEDLLRRDFTVNAIAWGRSASAASVGSPGQLIDPTGGRADLEARLLRAVGDPDQRFDEDALRLVRAARIAAQIGFTIEPSTLAAMTRHAGDGQYVSSERLGAELRRMVEATPPSGAFWILAATGLLVTLFPDLAAQQGVAQDKIPGHDLWDHSLATLDAAARLAPSDGRLKVAALLHDTGKPETLADGHFVGHDAAGARIATRLLERFAFPSREIDHIRRLIASHMFSYESKWSDAAVRRFMRRIGMDLMDDLIRLRQADNIGSGNDGDAGDLPELRARIREQRRAGAPLTIKDLAVDGHDLRHELDRPGGPWLGALLDRMLESVLADPSRNTVEQLLADARAWSAESTPS